MPSDFRACNELDIPFRFVPHGAAEPTEWMQRYPDCIKLPAAFVPHGAAEPSEWLQLYPDYIKLPATFVPHGGGDGQAGGSPDAPPPDQRGSSDEPPATADQSGTWQPTGSTMPTPAQSAPNGAPDRASTLDNPIAAYLKANDALAKAASHYLSEPVAASGP